MEGAIPQRIVSQTVLSDEVLWELGPEVRRRVVGVSKMADDATYSAVANRWPADVARIPGSSEALVAARPDLVIVADVTAVETTTLLQRSGIATLQLERFDGFDDFRRHAHRLAGAVGAKARGEAVVERFDAALSEHLSTVDDDAPTALSWIGGTVAGKNTIFDDEARSAGLRNAAAIGGLTGHGNVAIEQVVAWDPELVVTSCGDDCDRARAEIMSTPGLSATSAVRNGHVLAIEPRVLFSSGLGMIGVVERLAEARASLR
jgi:iron complex transport system substrate-binding protein